MRNLEQIWFGAALAFIITVACGPILIPFLKRLKFGQQIREEGPKWHQAKAGTPTMGGIIFILGILIASAILIKDLKTVMVLYLSISFGIIGFVDDYIKVVLKRNLGLTEKQKLLMQLAAAIIFIWVLYQNGQINSMLKLPMGFDLSYLFIPFTLFVIIGTVNAVNLTDGVDGLATSVTIIVMVLFSVAALGLGYKEIAIYAACVTGGCLGFLLFNRFPARVFMGDTGSLFLGGAIAGIAVVTGLPVVIAIAGGIYLMEALSVIIQVISFKTTGKRVFKMSPLHHHFEMSGWSEKKVVFVFTAITVVLCAVAYGLLIKVNA